MLAKSLGTNTIPWVMNVSPSIRQRIEEVTTHHSFQQWVDKTLKPEYMQHFHKNFVSGDYSQMRSFWGAPSCQSPHDIPEELNGLTWVREDVVAYTADDGSQSKQEATTLRGVSKLTLPKEVFQDFFDEIVSKEQGIYSWSVRGPRIFDKISCEKPDIISIQEYDCHDVVADYRGPGHFESFSSAMAAIGYSGVLLKDPLLGRYPPSGIGVFWKETAFETVAGISGMESLDCNTNGFGGSIVNADLEERWHPNNDKSSGKSELMKAADRRNGAICRLRHKESGNIVSLCTAHLMTTSRDGAKTNKFPGEVRASELVALRNLVESNAKEDDAVILVGDLNTDAKDAKYIFSGQLQAHDSETNLEFHTGFHVHTESFEWDTHFLKDAFADVHRWGDAVGEDKYCTSRNANRVEWIDYMFYDSYQLENFYLSDCKTPSSLIPDTQDPSDHLPLVAKFRFMKG
eukprot:scaffold368_cov125-Cylindrotheca_fusiformis.AAC.11